MQGRLGFFAAVLTLILTYGVLPVQTAVAAMPTDDKPLLASITEGTECDLALGCQPPLPEHPTPRFLRIDLKRKVVTILAPDSRKGETTAIQFVDRMEDRVVIGGTESKRVWSAILHQDGTMTMGLSDVGVGFVVFGNWMLAEDATK